MPNKYQVCSNPLPCKNNTYFNPLTSNCTANCDIGYYKLKDDSDLGYCVKNCYKNMYKPFTELDSCSESCPIGFKKY